MDIATIKVYGGYCIHFERLNQIRNTHRELNNDTFFKIFFLVRDGYCIYFEKISQMCNTYRKPKQ